MTEHSARLSKLDIVAVALGDLGGGSATLDTEDVAIAAHKMAPESFGWRKYPEQIDLEGVRLKLKNAAAAKADRRLIEGSVRTGWALTNLGAEWYVDNSERVRALLGVAKPRDHQTRRSETRKLAAERIRAQQLASWAKWSSREAVSIREARELFRVDAYLNERTRRLKVQGLVDLIGDDETVGEFVRAMAQIANQTGDNE